MGMGATCRPPPQLEVTICDFKLSNSTLSSGKMKSSGILLSLRQLPDLRVQFIQRKAFRDDPMARIGQN